MDTEQQFTKAFNHGFILAQFEPVLLHTITRNLAPVNNYVEGLFAGMRQLEYERNKQELENLRGQLFTRGFEHDFE